MRVGAALAAFAGAAFAYSCACNGTARASSASKNSVFFIVSPLNFKLSCQCFRCPFHWTVRVTFIECCNWFELPVTETVYVPDVVPGFVGPLLGLPQATIADAKQISNALNANSKARLRCDLLAKIAVTRQIKSKPSHAENIGTVGPLCGHNGKTEDGAVVEIVSKEVVLPEPGVALGGEKEHDVSDGNAEPAGETGFVNAPNCEPTLLV